MVVAFASLVMTFSACAALLWGAAKIYSHARGKQYTDAGYVERDRSHLRLIDSASVNDDRKP